MMMMMMMMMMMILPDIATKTCKSSIVLMVSALNIVVALRPTSVKTYDISAWLFLQSQAQTLEVRPFIR